MQRPALAALVFALMGALAAAKSASARRKSQIEQDAHLRVSA
jgi:hypothetical protein